MYLLNLRLTTFIFLLGSLVLPSCTKSHRVFINPETPVHISNIGTGLSVSIKVVDLRSSNVISKWQGGLKVRKFIVFSQGDLKEIFTAQVKQGLTKLGFLSKKYEPRIRRNLILEILSIKSRYQEKIPKMDVQVKADIRAICKNKSKSVSKIFSSHKKRFGITPATFPNENLLNASLSEVMGKIFSDKLLISCLAN